MTIICRLNILEWHNESGQLYHRASSFLNANSSSLCNSEKLSILESLLFSGLCPLKRFRTAYQCVAEHKRWLTQSQHTDLIQHIKQLELHDQRPKASVPSPNVASASLKPPMPDLQNEFHKARHMGPGFSTTADTASSAGSEGNVGGELHGVVTGDGSAAVAGTPSALPVSREESFAVKTRQHAVPVAEFYRVVPDAVSGIWASPGSLLAALVLFSGSAAAGWILIWLFRRLLRLTHTRAIIPVVRLWKRLLRLMFSHQTESVYRI